MSAFRSLSDYAKNAPDAYADRFGDPGAHDHPQPTEAEIAAMMAERPSEAAELVVSLEKLATGLDALAGAHAQLKTIEPTSQAGAYHRGRADGLAFAAERLRRTLADLKGV